MVRILGRGGGGGRGRLKPPIPPTTPPTPSPHQKKKTMNGKNKNRGNQFKVIKDNIQLKKDPYVINTAKIKKYHLGSARG